MDKIITPSFIKCKICNKRQAIALCDAIIGESQWCGHPPKIDGEYQKIPMSEPITCDIALCDRCRVRITDYMDLCPAHAIIKHRKGAV